MNNKYQLYVLLNSLPLKVVRLFVLLTSATSLPVYWLSTHDVSVPISIFAIVIVNELFIERLEMTKPHKKLHKDSVSGTEEMIFSARKKFDQSNNTFELVNKIIRKREVRFLSDSLGIEIAKLENTNIPKAELIKQAKEAAIWVDGTYLTEVDLFSAYILLSEDKTRYLKLHDLNNDDVINVLYWARRRFTPDKFERSEIRLFGSGVFDSLAYSWNFELKKYASNLTSEVIAKGFPPSVIGREEEYNELLIALSKRRESNAILIGEPGVGKKSIVEYLAYISFLGASPGVIAHKKVFVLHIDKLIAGVNSSGDLEARLSYLLSELAHSDDSILFMPNIEGIFGGGGFNLDISGVLNEYLEGGRIKIIGTTTEDQYSNYIEHKTNSAEMFEKIEVKELNEGRTLLLLTEKVREIEAKYGMKIEYSALKQVVNLSNVYFPDRVSPGRDIDLLETVCSKLEINNARSVNGPEVVSLVQAKTHVALVDPSEQEKELLLSLEKEIHNKVIGQDEAVKAVADSIRRLRSGFSNKERPISVMLFLGPTGVGKTEVAKALSAVYFGDKANMIRLDMSEYQTQDQIKRLLGENSGEDYVGNTLPEQVEKNPFSLILLDEFEKAHPHILDIFLQVFDEGGLTTNRGKKTSFKNTIIIATSNAGSEEIREGNVSNTNEFKKNLLESLLKKGIFKPELVNRFDEVVIFNSLTIEEVRKIAGILLKETLLRQENYSISFDEKVLEKIKKESYSPDFGARNIRRYIENEIESYLSKLILEDKINKGESVILSVDEQNNFIVKI